MTFNCLGIGLHKVVRCALRLCALFCSSGSSLEHYAPLATLDWVRFQLPLALSSGGRSQLDHQDLYLSWLVSVKFCSLSYL